MTQLLTASQLRVVREMAEWFMPPTAGFPTTGEADPDESVLHLVLEQFRPLLPQITAVLDEAAQEGVDAYLRRVREVDVETYELARTLFVGRYLTCRPVWSVLGYTGRRAIPIRLGEAEHDLRDDILGPVALRGKIYRPTPV